MIAMLATQLHAAADEPRGTPRQEPISLARGSHLSVRDVGLTE